MVETRPPPPDSKAGGKLQALFVTSSKKSSACFLRLKKKNPAAGRFFPVVHERWCLSCPAAQRCVPGEMLRKIFLKHAKSVRPIHRRSRDTAIVRRAAPATAANLAS